jgi:hypothetical protein
MRRTRLQAEVGPLDEPQGVACRGPGRLSFSLR